MKFFNNINIFTPYTLDPQSKIGTHMIIEHLWEETSFHLFLFRHLPLEKNHSFCFFSINCQKMMCSIQCCLQLRFSHGYSGYSVIWGKWLEQGEKNVLFFKISDMHLQNKKYRNFVFISRLTDKCATHKLKNLHSSSLWTCLHHMVILRSQNKIMIFL